MRLLLKIFSVFVTLVLLLFVTSLFIKLPIESTQIFKMLLILCIPTLSLGILSTKIPNGISLNICTFISIIGIVAGIGLIFINNDTVNDICLFIITITNIVLFFFAWLVIIAKINPNNAYSKILQALSIISIAAIILITTYFCIVTSDKNINYLDIDLTLSENRIYLYYISLIAVTLFSSSIAYIVNHCFKNIVLAIPYDDGIIEEKHLFDKNNVEIEQNITSSGLNLTLDTEHNKIGQVNSINRKIENQVTGSAIPMAKTPAIKNDNNDSKI